MILRKFHLIIPFVVFALTWQACKKQDNDRPVITLNGDALIYLPLQGNYIEYGASAHDTKDGDIAPLISGFVNTSGKATYTITYSATDKNGNVAKVVRTVIVQNFVEYLAGTYKKSHKVGFDTLTGLASDSSDYMQVVDFSSTINNRITFTKFANISFAPSTTKINADIAGVLLTIPLQNANIITTKHYYRGSGTVSGDSLIQIEYYDSLANHKAKRYTIRMKRK